MASLDGVYADRNEKIGRAIGRRTADVTSLETVLGAERKKSLLDIMIEVF